jgi:hypothetical protein
MPAHVSAASGERPPLAQQQPHRARAPAARFATLLAGLPDALLALIGDDQITTTRSSDASSRTQPDQSCAHHQYTLGPRAGLVHNGKVGRCLRHTRDPLDRPAAGVLHRALTRSPEDCARDTLSTSAEQAAADRLIAARLEIVGDQQSRSGGDGLGRS